MTDVYTRLAKYLDDLPAGYPPSDSGVELSILRKLFSPAEAEMFLSLRLIGETPRVVAYRARQPLETVTRLLDGMEQKGLISAAHHPGKLPEYAANQFVIGFLEEQVNHLDAELVALVDAYLPTFFKLSPWTRVPQLRTIPIGVSIPNQTDVMPYSRAEEIIHATRVFAVRNCVCRQSRALIHDGCDKPLETCLSFGSAAEHTVHTGRGRFITKADALAIFKQADVAGLVLQPANSKDPMVICACCGCCCGVLRNLKTHEKPANLVANPFIAHFDPVLCANCEICLERCQMGALSLVDGQVTFDPTRCIGCGLCVSTCATGALTLVQKNEVPNIPRDTISTYIQAGQAVGKMGGRELVSLVVKSRVDRLIAPR